MIRPKLVQPALPKLGKPCNFRRLLQSPEHVGSFSWSSRLPSRFVCLQVFALPQSRPSAGGLAGVTRHALMSVLRHLGVVRKEQNQYDFLTARALYAEHVVQEAPKVWEELWQNPGTENTLKFLKEIFFLPALAAAHIGRFLELKYDSLFSAHTCSALGPNALLMLQQMFPAETVSAAVDGPIWQEYLQRVMAKLRLELRPFAVRFLGPENADYLLSWEHACVSLYSLTLVEHLLCECRKIFQAENRAHKKRKTGTSDDEYLILWTAAWDAFLFP
jgi:hypothetical protein